MQDGGLSKQWKVPSYVDLYGCTEMILSLTIIFFLSFASYLLLYMLAPLMVYFAATIAATCGTNLEWVVRVLFTRFGW